MRVTKIIKSSKKKNKAMNKTELNKILKLHKLWLNGDPKGRCASLQDANLSGANLSKVNLSDANLKYAILSDANLEDAILSDANLEDADLSGANLMGADLSGADLSFVNLRNATFSKETRFPEGFDPVFRGMILAEEKVPEAPSPTKQEEVVAVAAVPAAPKTLHDELSEVFAKHGLVLVSFRAKPSKVRASKA